MKSGLAGHLEAQITRNPLSAADQILEACSRVGSGELDLKLSELRSLLVRALVGCREDAAGLAGDHPALAVFERDSVSYDSARFAAVCCLRLLGGCPTAFDEESAFSRSAIALLDKGFERDVYPSLGITVGDQTFVKVSRLRDVVPTLETEYTEILKSVSKLEGLPTLRNRLSKFLAGPQVRAVTGPFLPRSLVGAGIDELFLGAKAYASADGVEKIRIYEDTVGLIRDYLVEVRGFHTKYAREILGQLAEILDRVLHADFERSPYSKPADIEVLEPRKKVPLHHEGLRVGLPLIVRNVGPGHANDVRVRFESQQPLEFGSEDSELALGSLPPGAVELEVPATITVAVDSPASYLAEVTWTNVDGTEGEHVAIVAVEPQRSDVDWDQLGRERPYSLEPVTTEDRLVGRSGSLDRLFSSANQAAMDSFMLYGQKRVGKTSVALTLVSRIEAAAVPGLVPIYLEIGDVRHPSADATIRELGDLLCEQLVAAEPRLAGLEIPDFSSALAPIAKFLREAQKRVHDLRCLFIIDEFDGLPEDLFLRGTAGDAFFLTIRSVSNKPAFAFVLVGSEDLEFILRHQGTALNKFVPERLDYFDKDQHWNSFLELVRAPVASWLEISDDAVELLYEKTAGNPYFLNLICEELFGLAVELRDAHLTAVEVQRAARRAVTKAKSNAFQHFWEDGVLEAGEQRGLVRLQRRMLLFSLASLFRSHPTVDRELLADHASAEGIDFGGESTIADFVRRGVLSEGDGGLYCPVGVFQDWLCERGGSEIAATHTEFDELRRVQTERDELFVTPREIVELVSGWSTYKGQRLTEDSVRAWLEQFGGIADQRLMFQLLQGTTFYGTAEVREKMREAHGIVTRGIVLRLSEGQRKRSDILVSHLGAVAKSGVEYARIYADENQVYADNVVARNELRRVLEERKGELAGLVFVDDIIGSGKTFGTEIEALREECGELLSDGDVRVAAVVVCATTPGLARAQKLGETLPFGLRVHVCDSRRVERCFDEGSDVFRDARDRERAKDVCFRHGRQLERRAPLGYGGCEATVVMPNSCPNNTLPVLWKRTADWTPLFRRH